MPEYAKDMKTKTYSIPVKEKQFSRIADPTGMGHDTVYALVKISDLPLDLPMDVNPRSQNTESRVARQIQQGLLENASEFHLLNRGVTITAHAANYDKKKETLDLELASHHYGLVDGGHTYAIIRKNAKAYHAEQKEPKEPAGEKTESPEFLENGFVRMEVVLGVKDDLLVDIARSRNTSAQVRDESLANLEGSFDWLKETLEKQTFASQIAYRENEDDAVFPIDIREIVSLLTLFLPNFQESEKPPIVGYTSKGRCLDLFRDQPDAYKSLKPIIPDILKLYDYIHLKFAELYKEIGGFGSVGEEEKRKRSQKGVKLAKVIGVKAIKEGFPLYYKGEKAYYLFPDGWLLPMLSSLRAIVSYKGGTAKWKANPFQFFDKTGNALVQMTLETSVNMGRNPNAVGKNKSHWIQLHAHELNQYIKALNIDLEQEIKLAA